MGHASSQSCCSKSEQPELEQVKADSVLEAHDRILGAQWYPLPFFWFWVPLYSNQPQQKKAALIVVWLPG